MPKWSFNITFVRNKLEHRRRHIHIRKPCTMHIQEYLIAVRKRARCNDAKGYIVNTETELLFLHFLFPGLWCQPCRRAVETDIATSRRARTTIFTIIPFRFFRQFYASTHYVNESLCSFTQYRPPYSTSTGRLIAWKEFLFMLRPWSLDCHLIVYSHETQQQ